MQDFSGTTCRQEKKMKKCRFDSNYGVVIHHFVTLEEKCVCGEVDNEQRKKNVMKKAGFGDRKYRKKIYGRKNG